MKFLKKSDQSTILTENLRYNKNASRNNAILLAKLCQEQLNFCAYTEKYREPLDSFEVEHFNATKKYNDDNYFNYYAVVRGANIYKRSKDGQYQTKAQRLESFFGTLFFQNEEEFNKRINYSEGLYDPNDNNDTEARDLIDYLGLNNQVLYDQRKKHIERLKETLVSYSPNEKKEYFSRHKADLSFITAIEKEFGLDLNEIIQT